MQLFRPRRLFPRENPFPVAWPFRPRAVHKTGPCVGLNFLRFRIRTISVAGIHYLIHYFRFGHILGTFEMEKVNIGNTSETYKSYKLGFSC